MVQQEVPGAVVLAEALLPLHCAPDPEQACRTILQSLTPLCGAAYVLRIAADRPGGAGRAVSFAGGDGPVFARLRAAGCPVPRRFDLTALLGQGGAGAHGRLWDVRALGEAPGELAWVGQAAAELGTEHVVLVPAPDTGAPAWVLLLFVAATWPDAVAQLVAAHLVAATANLLRVQDLQRSAEIDPETLVHTSRRFESEAAREVLRAARHWQPLSLVVVRPAGGGNLREIAAALMRTIRRSDIVGRLEPDGFGLILPETGASGAARVLARLSERAARGQFSLHAGTATFPEDGRTWDALQQAAHARLHPVESGPASWPELDGTRAIAGLP
jgi:GGDEF domain-containing protein